ncbi:unnamed protein product [Rotaria magnacalcarata]|uniref:Glycerol-3-phosphate dehydrogenase [NAD(+)] n=1 Tax=Rotaria magnacalcarata TaxID=392030 RepID=A0A817AFE1_9BILA|nr:unnamed protein product [Rotaria magnacalcarata]CAF2242829.1 unnamed protein product [Rotaria magnacalcarata]
MTIMECAGCTLIAFGVPFSMFVFTIAHHPFRIIIAMTSAFFWLISLLLSSLLWFAVVPLRNQLAFAVPFTVLFQEIFRYLFYRLIKKAEFALQKAQMQELTAKGMVFDRFAVAYASGYGFGLISGTFAIVNVLSDMTGPGTIGIFGHSPDFFIATAFLALCIILLNTFWGVIFYTSLDKDGIHRFIGPAIVVFTHMLFSCMTLLNRKSTPTYSISIVIGYVLLVGMMFIARVLHLHFDFLRKNRHHFSYVRNVYRMASSSLAKKKIAVVGSGNWGSAIACHIGDKVRQLNGQYHEQILMWCKEEILDDGRKLTEVINQQHENIKYLPDRKIPENIIAIPDLDIAVKDADIIIFVIPHQYVKNVCEQLKNNIKKDAFALTLIKGFYVDEQTKELTFVSQIIKNTLNIPCASMMGANIANEVAKKIFCEATVGCRDDKHSEIIRQLIDTPVFRLRFFPDIEIIEMLGGLKNIVSMLAGFAEGLDTGFNTRAAILRLGFVEMINFCRLYKKESTPDIYLQSCGIADLIASSLGGRNYRGAKTMVQTKDSLAYIEKKDFNGQSLQGPSTAKEVYRYLHAQNLLDRFPLFRDTHLICESIIKPHVFLDNLGNHPEFH